MHFFCKSDLLATVMCMPNRIKSVQFKGLLLNNEQIWHTVFIIAVFQLRLPESWQTRAAACTSRLGNSGHVSWT